ncbi:MAG TPA: nucleotidyltransferase family protein [Clostridia bacterium]|nr:nucleotidyltransferase family protein [Clostridia bacterium]
MNDTPAVILAGGLGTRLRSVYHSGPKSMAPVGGRPFLEYLLMQLKNCGVREVILCVGFKRSYIQRWAGKGRRWGLDLHYSVEGEPKGTAGALSLAADKIGKRSFLLLNGDSIVDCDIATMVSAHRQRRALVTMALPAVSHSGRYGSVRLDNDGCVRAFVEKQARGDADVTQSSLINGGVYVFEPEVLDLIPQGRQVSLEKEILPSLVGDRFLGFKTTGYFIDIGVPEDFTRAQSELREHFQS